MVVAELWLFVCESLGNVSFKSGIRASLVSLAAANNASTFTIPEIDATKETFHFAISSRMISLARVKMEMNQMTHHHHHHHHHFFDHY